MHCWGVYLPRGCICLVGVPAGGDVSAWGGVPAGGVPTWGCTCLGVVPAPAQGGTCWGGLPLGGVPAGGYLPPPPWTEWQTGAKILPCPKLRLRAVITPKSFKIGAENANFSLIKLFHRAVPALSRDNQDTSSVTLNSRLWLTGDGSSRDAASVLWNRSHGSHGQGLRLTSITP